VNSSQKAKMEREKLLLRRYSITTLIVKKKFQEHEELFHVARERSAKDMEKLIQTLGPECLWCWKSIAKTETLKKQ
jgi:hypothetical protein